MSTTVLDQKLSREELETAIYQFAQARDTGALGTRGSAGLRVSPVKYFTDDGLNVYIQSKGGSKFENLSDNDEACLLVSTPFRDDYHQIQGVQFFGQAQVLQPISRDYEVATSLCPWPHDSQAKWIKIRCHKVVYVDRIHHEDLKQEWLRHEKVSPNFS